MAGQDATWKARRGMSKHCSRKVTAQVSPPHGNGFISMFALDNRVHGVLRHGAIDAWRSACSRNADQDRKTNISFCRSLLSLCIQLQRPAAATRRMCRDCPKFAPFALLPCEGKKGRSNSAAPPRPSVGLRARRTVCLTCSPRATRARPLSFHMSDEFV